MKHKEISSTGLTKDQVILLQKKFGKNELINEKKESFFIKIIHTLCEPMFLLLIIASIIYFILGEPKDGLVMSFFVIVMITIDIIQEWKTDKTLNALKDLSEPKITVLRDNKKIEISSTDLVPGDIMYIHEGIKIPADGFVIKCSGLCVDESSLTGESEPVFKTTEEYMEKDYFRNDYCYQGTLVTQGSGIIQVDKIGFLTEYGKIGKNISDTKTLKTPLQQQTDKLVKLCAIIAGILFILVSIFTFFNVESKSFGDKLIESILSGITLAMAMIPEEFPVVLTVFLSMGAWRLAKKHSLVKKLPSVETLGAISILCVDKTGTITQNKMQVEKVIPFNCDESELALIMGLCCEEDTYDPMEKAMLNFCEKISIKREMIFNGKKIKEYPFNNATKMMGTVFEKNNEIILSAKGSPESIISICSLNNQEKRQIIDEMTSLQKSGYRVIAVAKKIYDNVSNITQNLDDEELQYLGLVGLIDPPRESIKNDIKLCKKANIRVIMITGDNGLTAASIASMVGITNVNDIITGEELNKMNDEELKEKVKTASIFSRVIPEHKMRIVSALQANGEIVGMTGDGVNDAPALKKADIGISMGKHGSEVSREASDLILMDDNFSTIIDTIKDGRRIYDNIKKAIGYIFVIHIPIALASLLAPILKISTENLMLLPIHIVLLELIIDPTCSIVLERQPSENNIMNRKPRHISDNLVNKRTVIKSIIQGVIIFLSSFISYYLMLNKTNNAALARSIGLLIIMFANIFLVQVNSSDNDLAIQSLKKLVKDKLLCFINFIMLLAIILIIYSPLNQFLKLQSLSIQQLTFTIVIAFISVYWYEIVKIIKLKKNKNFV